MLLSSLMFFVAATEPVGKNETAPVKEDAFAGRENGTIAFASQIDGFSVKREGRDDILYLNTGFGRWYRAPLTCFGMGDPGSAMGIIPYDYHGASIDKFSRFKLLGIDRMDKNECSISALIELTPQETVTFGLESQKQVDSRLAKAKPKN